MICLCSHTCCPISKLSTPMSAKHIPTVSDSHSQRYFRSLSYCTQLGYHINVESASQLALHGAMASTCHCMGPLPQPVTSWGHSIAWGHGIALSLPKAMASTWHFMVPLHHPVISWIMASPKHWYVLALALHAYGITLSLHAAKASHSTVTAWGHGLSLAMPGF